MAKIPDKTTLEQLCKEAAQALARAGLEHRIDIFREVEVDDPAVRMMLGRPHRLRLRIRITAESLLFEGEARSEREPKRRRAPSALLIDTTES